MSPRRDFPKRVVVVGSGVIGLAHAITAWESGARVVVLERSTEPLGASVRNFGLLLPLGVPFGPARDRLFESLGRWHELARKAEFLIEAPGALCLAYRDSSWQVLQEFQSLPAATEAAGCRLLTNVEIARRFPAVNATDLRGGLFSPHEHRIQPRDAVRKLIAYASGLGIEFHFGRCAVRVDEDQVETGNGERFPFDHLLIAAGDETRILFPEEFAAAPLRRCQLHMMRTGPLPIRLGAILMSDLSVARYAAFDSCRSVGALRSELAEMEAECVRHGIHVLAVQHADGTLTLGDSHAYADDFDPEQSAAIDDLILRQLDRIARLPDLQIAARWMGHYLRSTGTETEVVLHPRPNVTAVAALAGLGMTLSWAVARDTIDHWQHGDSPRPNRSAAARTDSRTTEP